MKHTDKTDWRKDTLSQKRKYKTTIPFSGFYESEHDANIDNAVNRYFDKEGTGNGDMLIPDDFYFSFNHFGKIHDEYAKLYVKNFEDFFNGETGLNIKLTYEELVSPREYNFTTDRVFVVIRLADIKAMRKYVPDSVLAERIKDRFTSGSGFISFYSNDLETWKAKPLANWDSNEVGTLLEAALIHSGADCDNLAYEVMESPLCNGEIDIIVYPYLEQWERDNPDGKHAKGNGQ